MMTLEEYYTKKSALQAPEGLEYLEERKWFIESLQKLQDELSESDLKIVLYRQQRWQDKVNSSFL
ncbi:hypothetical protein [Flavobacterium restrictum]|uniref:Uncharacterized protein n=1 Tax=Flavobacterium restrictum TaxID=2594428 RepID=A0A553E291_9FLAO|nr:hypothetical protein [Flavobacterium restrictum]TRX39075.1 hypothetical protein FNW21_10845 [Flavobacterium restrictum]